MQGYSSAQYPYHAAIFGKVLVDDLRSQGFSDVQIIGNTGIKLIDLERATPFLRFDQLAELFERAAVLLDDTLFGFKRGQRRELRRLGLIAFVGMSSPTIKSFFQNAARYRRVFSDAIQLDVSRLDGEGIVEWQFNVPEAINRRQYVEFGASGGVRELRHLTGRNISPTAVEFRHQRSDGAKEIERYFGCTVTFGSDTNRLHLKTLDLGLPLRTADGYLFRTLQECCEQAIAKLPDLKPSLILQIEKQLAEWLASGEISQARVAKSIGMSPRTLSRRLSEEGTNFSSVVGTYRLSFAKNLITITDLPLTEIAYLLGYQDLSSFGAAFKRWTDQAPSEFRKSYANDP